jgi:hypothetical protein
VEKVGYQAHPLQLLGLAKAKTQSFHGAAVDILSADRPLWAESEE